MLIAVDKYSIYSKRIQIAEGHVRSLFGEVERREELGPDTEITESSNYAESRMVRRSSSTQGLPPSFAERELLQSTSIA